MLNPTGVIKPHVQEAQYRQQMCTMHNTVKTETLKNSCYNHKYTYSLQQSFSVGLVDMTKYFSTSNTSMTYVHTCTFTFILTSSSCTRPPSGVECQYASKCYQKRKTLLESVEGLMLLCHLMVCSCIQCLVPLRSYMYFGTLDASGTVCSIAAVYSLQYSTLNYLHNTTCKYNAL